VVGKYISLESKIAKNKGVYYEVLEECQQGWHDNEDNPTPFIKYILQIILAAYRDFEDRVDLVGNKVSAMEMVEKAVYSRIGKFTKNDIIELCPTIGKTSVESSLKKMCHNGDIVKMGSGRATFYVRSDAL
jgi:Fic family protein